VNREPSEDTRDRQPTPGADAARRDPAPAAREPDSRGVAASTRAIAPRWRTPALRRPRRLVVADDSADFRSFVCAALRDLFVDTVEVADGRSLFWTVEGLARARRADDPELVVVSDVFMPHYTGLEVLEAWQGASFDVPVVLVSAFADRALAERVRASGALLLAKPFPLHTLRAAVRAAIAGAPSLGGRDDDDSH
jgi:two-component system response regulator (stage 0 sporulation protein F)